MRKLSWIIAGILCTTAPMTALHAAQLGNAQVESKLTQQLKVKIPIDDVKGVALDDIDVRLAPRSYYDQSGLSLDKVQGNLIFKIKKGKTGPYVVVTSRRPVMDPIFSFLLQVSSGNSSNIREYDLLLDPPLHRATAATPKKVVVASTAAPQQAAPNTKATEAPAKPRSSWVPPKSVPQVQMGATYTVKRGDTLYEIASKATKEKKVPVRGMMQAIINENPKAFPNGDGNLMLAGAKLKVPQAVVADQAKMASTPESAGNESQPKLTLLSAKGSESAAPAPEANENSSGTETSTAPSDSTATPSTPDTASSQTEAAAPTQEEPATQAPAASMPADKLPAIDSTQKPSASEEDIASIQAHNEAMSKQIGMLNDQLKQVQDQMTTRNERIEKLQQQVQSAETLTNQLKQKLHSQTESFWSKWGLYLTGGLGVLVIFLLLLALSNRKRSDAEPSQPAASTGPKIDSDIESGLGEDTLDASDIDTTSGAAATLGEMPDPVIASGMHDDASAAIQEAQLLVSYNLHGQAVDLLKDTMDRHPDDVQVYRALAEIYASEGSTDELNDILERIETRFGADQRPDIQADEKTVAVDEPSTEEGASPVETAEEAAPETELSAEEDFGSELAEAEPEMDHEKPADPLLDSIDFDSGAPLQSTGLEELDLTEEEPKRPQTDESDGLELDLGSDLETSGAETEEPALEDAGLSFDESAADEEPLEPVAEEGAAPQLSSSSDDTRLGLAEAFLNVGDMESFKMIADEITAEGNQELIDKLEQIRQAHQGD